MVEHYTPAALSEGLLAGLLRWTLKLLLKPIFSPNVSIGIQRRWLRLVAALTLVPRGVHIETASVEGVPGEWVRPTGSQPVKPGVMLYLHGGAYCVGSPSTHRAITARLALATGLPVFAADYRLAPEHPYPAALEDALAAFEGLRSYGPIVIAGDSAGGGLALATALALRDRGSSQAAALVLLSPWADMRSESTPTVEPPGEAMLSHRWAMCCAKHYLGPVSPGTPLVSPILADLRGLPPTLIQAGTDEMLHDQSKGLADAMDRAGVSVRCEITRHRWHVFQMHGGLLRCADEAIARIARFTLMPLVRATPARHSRHEIVILGAGMSGLCMGVQLRQAGLHDFVILEKQDGLGGTWWDNTYPGAQVDVPAPVYSLSFAPNPQWKSRFAAAGEIQRYMQSVAEEHRLLGHMRVATCITQARFDADTGSWHFVTESGDTLESRFFICSTGPLSQPRWPDIPGLENFQGKRIHSARWDHQYDLTGKRVAVIGTGSTASQIIPELAKKVDRLHVYQRTANWVLPRLERKYNWLDRLLAHFPPYSALVRRTWIALLELNRLGFSEGTWMRKRLLQLADYHIRTAVPDIALRAKLTPPYPLGCKRLIFSNDLFPAFMQPHVELLTEGIEGIGSNAVLSRDGSEREVDALVCATGFETVQLLSSIQVKGLHGGTLRDAWAQGPEAFHGINVAGFPNMFLLLGPNTATGHTSTLLYIEPEVRRTIECMQTVQRGNFRWIDVRPEVMKAHNEFLQRRLNGSVWASCRSWYRMDNGRITALFPGFTSEYVKALSKLDLRDYELV